MARAIEAGAGDCPSVRSGSAGFCVGSGIEHLGIKGVD